MELLTANKLLEHTIRFSILILGIGFAVILGKYRPEWKSRKTLISWIWTMAAIDVLIMDSSFATTLTAQMFIGGALLLNIINFIGDRIETIKFKDFSASLGQEDQYDKEHSMRKKKKPVEPETTENWPDGTPKEENQNPVPSPKCSRVKNNGFQSKQERRDVPA